MISSYRELFARSAYQGFEIFDQYRQVIFNRVPNFVEIYFKISMRNPIPHASDKRLLTELVSVDFSVLLRRFSIPMWGAHILLSI